MIEMISAKSAAPAGFSQEPYVAELSRPRAEQEPATAKASGFTPAPVNEQQGRVTAANQGFEVHLDGETMRVYSELRDPQTEQVIVRIPAGYEPKKPTPPDYHPTSLVA